MATIFAAIIGLDRKEHNHPAGLRTHILVCLGACILALIQEAICNQVLYYAKNFHTLSTVLESDPARLIAQVIGGIGFIGAGTIVITHHFVMGLTTAASLWATASIGLAIGMGYYCIAIVGGAFVLLVVVILRKIVKVNTYKQVEFKYIDRHTLDQILQPYFKQNKIQVKHFSFKVDTNNQINKKNVYICVCNLKFPKNMTYLKMAQDLAMNNNIFEISLVTL